jgi:CBS domain-containing protein
MLARNLASPQPSVPADAPAHDAATILVRPDIAAILVVHEGRLVGAISDEDVLRHLLPDYLRESDALARSLEEDAVRQLWSHIDGLTASDIAREVPTVDADATLIEVAAAMVHHRSRVVGVVDDRLIGGITIDDLLSHLRVP